MRRKLFISFILLCIISILGNTHGFQEVDPNELDLQSEEMMESFKMGTDESLLSYEIWLYTEADCDNIRWTLEGQTHSEPLFCGRTIGFVGVPYGTYHTVAEGCGGRISGYLDVYKDLHLVICPSDLSTTDCCPEGIYPGGDYFCDDECPDSEETTTTTTYSTGKCNDYDWNMVNMFNESASSTWGICSNNRITFEITSVTDVFFLCELGWKIIQGSNQMFVYGWESRNSAYIHYNERWYDGCDDIVQGVRLTGWIDNFPSWFDIFDPFTIKYDRDNLDVDGAPVPPTTTSSSTSTSTTTSVPSTTSTTTSAILTTTTTIPAPVPTTTSSSSSTTTTNEVIDCPMEKLYGKDSEELELLRYFRNNVLSKIPEGQEIINLYYQWSPVLTKIMEEDEKFREEVKETIDVMLVLFARE